MTAIGTKAELLNKSAISLVVAPEWATPRMEIHTAPKGSTIAELLAFACNKGSLDVADIPLARVFIDGEELELAESLDFVPEPGATVNVNVTVHGDTRSLVRLFFQIGQMVVTAMFGPIWGTAVALVGQVVDYAIWGGGPDQLAATNDRGALMEQSNQYRRRSSFPIVAGRQRVGFDVAALPYTQLRGNEVWLHVVFGLHYGPCTVEDIRIGETLLSDYPTTDVIVEKFLTPGPRVIQNYPSRVAQENLNDELDLAGTGTYEVRTAPERVDRIEIDVTFPQGLRFTNDKGKISNEEVSGRIEIAEEGTEAWVPAQIGQFRNKNGALLPVGTWYVNAKSADPIRRTFGFDVDKTKRWKVRQKAWDDEGRYPTQQAVMSTYWTALRGIERTAPIIDQTLSVISMTIRSSGDLNGTLPVVSGIVTPIVPIWSSATQQWKDDPADWEPSSNAAAIARWLTTSSAAAKPLELSEIDESSGVAYELIEERGWTGGLDFRDEVTLGDALAALGRMGRFTCYWNGSALCFVPDWEKPAPRQLFTGKNVASYRYRRVFQEDDPHGIMVEFKNLDRDSAGDELIVYLDGYGPGNAENFLTLRLDFACTASRAYKEARVYAAKRIHQTESHEWTAGIESVISTYGDRVLTRHATALFGLAEVRVRARQMAGALVAGIDLSDPVVMEAGKSYAIDIQRDDETIRGVAVVTAPGQVKTLMFPAPIPVGSAPLPGNLCAFGEVGFVTEDVEIVDITPGEGNTANIRAVRYAAAEIEAAETGPIPPLPNNLTPKAVAPIPRLVGSPTGSPDGVIVAFDLDPLRAATVDGISARWRVSYVDPENPEERDSSWSLLPSQPSSSRMVRTPPFAEAQLPVGDIDGIISVDVEVWTTLRNGDRSQPLRIIDVPIRRPVPTPIGFYAQGVVKASATDGSSYPALEAGCDSVDAGIVKELRIEVAEDDGGEIDPATWRPLGQPLPAANPEGIFVDVDGGERYAVRAKWVTADGWSSAWVEKSGPSAVDIPSGGRVSDDTNHVGGVPASTLVNDLASAVALAETAMASVEVIEGDYQVILDAKDAAVTAASSATGSATAASTSATLATTKATEAGDAATAAQASQVAASNSASTATTAAATAVTKAEASETAAEASEASATNASTAAGQAVTASNASSSARDGAVSARDTAQTAASTAQASKAAMLPPRLDTDGSNFTLNANGSASGTPPLATTEDVAGFGLAGRLTFLGTVWNRGVMPFKTGRVYRVRARAEIVGSGTHNVRVYVRGQNGAFATVDNATGGYVAATAGTPIEITFLYGNPAPAGGGSISANCIWTRAGVQAATLPEGGHLRIYEIYHEDITESSSAAGYAATALTQSSQATASAAEAKIQADIASGVGASVAGVLKDPTMQNWPAGNPLPTGWGAPGGGGGVTVTRQTTNLIYGDKALRLTDVGGGSGWLPILAAAFGPATTETVWVCEYEITLNSGDLKRFGVQFRSNRTTGYYGANVDLAADHLDATVGATYRRAKLFTIAPLSGAAGSPTNNTAWFYTNLASFSGGTSSAKDLTVHMLQFRPATAEEIARGIATPQIAASLKILAATASDLAARVGRVFFKVTGGTSTGDPFAIEATAGDGASSASMTATRITLRNIIDGSLVDALDIQSGNAVLRGNLTAGGGIYLGTGTVWAVALRSQTFSRSDGETISFGTANIGIPTYEFMRDNLLPLAAGETYELLIKGLTGTGGTVWAKILTPGTPSSQTVPGPGTVSGTGPTRQLTKTPKPDSTDGNYTVSIYGTYGFEIPRYSPMRDWEGTVSYGVWARKAGVWTKVGTMLADWYYTGDNPSPNFLPVEAEAGVIGVVQMGEGIEAFGVTLDGSTGPIAGRTVTLSSFGPVSWTSPGSSSGTRSALASGVKTTIKITPQG